MNKTIVSAAVIFTAVTALIIMTEIRSLEDLVNLCIAYPLQVSTYAYNAAVVVLGYVSKSFWLLFACALIDLVMTAMAVFTLV